MHIVGHHDPQADPSHVHTIDVWFSARRRVWIVERLNDEGHQIGPACACPTEDDARDCVEDWLRAHTETHLVAPPQIATAAVAAVRRRAA